MKKKLFFQDILYLIPLLLLLGNDFYLKSEYGNFWTGKISDFSGLFVFPAFFALLLPKHKKTIYTLTALMFIFWKSAFSTSIIAFWNNYSFLHISRVVDYTDFFALVILPLSYYSLSIRTYRLKLNPIIPICLSSFAFLATSHADPNIKEPENLFDKNPIKYGRVLDFESPESIELECTRKNLIEIINKYELNYPCINANLDTLITVSLKHEYSPPYLVCLLKEQNQKTNLFLKSIVSADTSINGSNTIVGDKIKEDFKSWFPSTLLLFKKIDSLYTKGETYKNTYKVDSAIICFKKAIEIAPLFPVTKLMINSSLGDCFYAKEDFYSALNYYYLADSLNGMYSSFHFRSPPFIGLKNCYEMIGKKDSVDKYEKVIHNSKIWEQKLD